MMLKVTCYVDSYVVRETYESAEKKLKTIKKVYSPHWVGLDSNPGPLVSEASVFTTIPRHPPPQALLVWRNLNSATVTCKLHVSYM